MVKRKKGPRPRCQSKSNFTTPAPFATLRSNMSLFRSWFLLLPMLLVAGCQTTVTNLTPREQIRNANGLYPFEAAWHSNQATIRENSIKAFLIIGLESYPMQPTSLVKNRWETLAPVPANESFISYRYKFEYNYNRIPEPGMDSRLSPPYTLHIIDK